MQKGAFCGFQNTPKSVFFRPGLRLAPRWGSSRRSPRSHSRLERGHHSNTPLHLALNPLALAMHPPQNSSQIYAYVCVVQCKQSPTIALVMSLSWQSPSVARPRHLWHRPASRHTLYVQRFTDHNTHFSLFLARDACCHLVSRRRIYTQQLFYIIYIVFALQYDTILNVQSQTDGL